MTSLVALDGVFPQGSFATPVKDSFPIRDFPEGPARLPLAPQLRGAATARG